MHRQHGCTSARRGQVVNAQGVYFNAFQCSSVGNCSLVPINVNMTPYLILYGTGIRGAA